MKVKSKTNKLVIDVNEEEPDFYRMVARDAENGEEIGMVSFSLKNQRYGRIAWLYKIEVKEPYQNKGMGTSLLYCFEKFCADHRVSTVEGKYYPENETAVHFYRNNGYQVDIDGYEQLIFKSIVSEVVDAKYNSIEIPEQTQNNDGQNQEM